MALLDEIDIAILNLLKKNARISYTRIAEKLGISESTVRKRVKALVEDGYIERFTIEQGRGIRAIVLINSKIESYCPSIAKKIVKIKGVEKVYEISGQYDLAAIIFAPSSREINEVIEKIRSIEGVERTYTCIVLDSHYNDSVNFRVDKTRR